MRKNISGLAYSLFSIVFIVIVIGKYVIVAQTAITGEWRSENWSDKKEKDGKIHLSFERRSENGDRNQHCRSKTRY